MSYVKTILEEKKCPDCGGDVVDDRLKKNSHKGHGKIWCSRCNKVLIII